MSDSQNAERETASCTAHLSEGRFLSKVESEKQRESGGMLPTGRPKRMLFDLLPFQWLTLISLSLHAAAIARREGNEISHLIVCVAYFSSFDDVQDALTSSLNGSLNKNPDRGDVGTF